MAEKKESEPIEKVKWFSDLIKNLPKPSGESFTDRVLALESAKVLTAASQATINAVAPQPRTSGVEKGISEGLEQAGKQIITEKLTGKDPISSKVMDVIANVAADALRDRLGSGGGRASEAELELARRDRQDELNTMFSKFHDDVVGPLAEQVNELADKGKGSGSPMTIDNAVDMVLAAQDRAKKLLTGQGYSVENVTVTKEAVKKMLKEEQTKYDERLKGAQKEWEKESGATVEVEKERIRATETILTGVTDRVFDIFLEPVKDEIHKAIKSGAFRRGQ